MVVLSLTRSFCDAISFEYDFTWCVLRGASRRPSSGSSLEVGPGLKGLKVCRRRLQGPSKRQGPSKSCRLGTRWWRAVCHHGDAARVVAGQAGSTLRLLRAADFCVEKRREEEFFLRRSMVPLGWTGPASFFVATWLSERDRGMDAAEKGRGDSLPAISAQEMLQSHASRRQ